MIIVETPVKTIENEIQSLESICIGPATKMYILGAIQALRWIKDGAIPASKIHEVLSNPNR